MLKSKSPLLIALLFLTTQPPVFCSTDGKTLSGPHEIDHSARISEGVGLYSWLQVRGAVLTEESESTVQNLVDDLVTEGFTPVFICGQIQVAALREIFPNIPCLNPAMLQDLGDRAGKGAPGLILSAGTLDEEELREIGRMLGFVKDETSTVAV